MQAMRKQVVMIRYFITGGNGFIGRHVVDLLLKKGHEVTVYDISPARETRVRYIRGSILDCNKLRKSMQGYDIAIHLAALISVNNSFKHASIYKDVNVLGTYYICNAAQKAKIKRLVFLSSASVYGDKAKCPIKEISELNPLSPYAATKIAAERIVKRMDEYIILRPFNVYSYDEKGSESVIKLWMDRLNKGKPPIIYGSGQQIRDYIHVGDVAKAIYFASRIKAKNKIINIGTGKGTSLVQLAKKLNNRLGTDIFPEYRKAKKGDIPESVADTTLMKQLLKGFNPKRL